MRLKWSHRMVEPGLWTHWETGPEARFHLCQLRVSVMGCFASRRIRRRVTKELGPG